MMNNSTNKPVEENIVYKYSLITIHQNPIITLFSSIIIFAFIYNFLGKTNFIVANNEHMTLFNSFYFSVTTQTLLGIGDITPKYIISKFFVITQIMITILVTFFHIKK